MKMVKSISGISFHWKCENPNCSYESREITIDRRHPDPQPPKLCPKCKRGRQKLGVNSWNTRRSPRSPLAIPIRLISEKAGKCWEEDTHTLDVSRHGARTTCQNVVEEGDILKVLRLDNGEQFEGRVVWQRQTDSGTQEIAVEINGDKDFWIP